jgi:hypothetical protein
MCPVDAGVGFEGHGRRGQQQRGREGNMGGNQSSTRKTSRSSAGWSDDQDRSRRRCSPPSARSRAPAGVGALLDLEAPIRQISSTVPAAVDDLLDLEAPFCRHSPSRRRPCALLQRLARATIVPPLLSSPSVPIDLLS